VRARAHRETHLVHVYISRSVCETVGLLCNREHRSPCLHAPICIARNSTSHTWFIRIVRVSDERKHSKERERKRRRRSKKEESLARREREREREQKRTRNATKSREERAERRRERRERSKFLSFPNRRTKERVYYPNTHLEVKRTVHAILLRPEDGRQVFRHLCARLSILFFFCV